VNFCHRFIFFFDFILCRRSSFPVHNFDNSRYDKADLSSIVFPEDFGKAITEVGFVVRRVKHQLSSVQAITKGIKNHPVFFQDGAKEMNSDHKKEKVQILNDIKRHLNDIGLQFESRSPTTDPLKDYSLYDTNRKMTTFDTVKESDKKILSDIYDSVVNLVPSDFSNKKRWNLKHDAHKLVLLQSDAGARRQGVHMDTLSDDSIIAMSSEDGRPFSIGILCGSHHAVDRLRQLRKIWIENGCPVPTLQDGSFLDPEVCKTLHLVVTCCSQLIISLCSVRWSGILL
jgi:hypothetical protein